jgi:hypothetical protein
MSRAFAILLISSMKKAPFDFLFCPAASRSFGSQKGVRGQAPRASSVRQYYKSHPSAGRRRPWECRLSTCVVRGQLEIRHRMSNRWGHSNLRSFKEPAPLLLPPHIKKSERNYLKQRTACFKRRAPSSHVARALALEREGSRVSVTNGALECWAELGHAVSNLIL